MQFNFKIGNCNIEAEIIIFNRLLNIIEQEKKISIFPIHHSGLYRRIFFKANKNLIALVFRNLSSFSIMTGFNHKIVIMNKSLEVLHETSADEKFYFIGGDDECIYTLSDLVKNKVNVLDWNLKLLTVIYFQSSHSNNSFYLAGHNRIEQFNRKNLKSFVLSNNTMHIYDQHGNLLNQIQTIQIYYNMYLDHFQFIKFDSNHLLVLNREKNLLSYYDLFGNQIKCVHIDMRGLKDYGIDQNDKIYAYDSNFLYSLC